ncbi:extracellular solute-binding protein [Natrarchaeobius sp. A-rgal3]|uniref:extracellular solute-binding protein n=1 Tax=Natrarchaeobius versutus TaxID=1679078 RepID=UPI00350F887A
MFVKSVGATGAASGLAGCIGGEENGNGADEELTEETDVDAEIELQVTTNSDIADESDAVREMLWENGLSEDVFPHLVEVGEVTDDMEAEYRSWLAAGRSTPDLLIADSGWTIPLIVRDQLVNLEEELPGELVSEIHEEYFEMSVESAVHPETGELYAVPLYPDFPTIQYRKDLVEDAGYDPDGEEWATNPLSWAEFSAVVADTLESHDDVEYGYTWQAPPSEQLSCCVFNEMITSWGGAYFGGPDNLYGPVGDRPVTVDEEPVIDALRMGRTLIRGEDDEFAMDAIEGISPDAVVQWDVEPSRAPFTDGDAVAHRNWPYSIAINGADDVHGEDMGVMPLPYGVPEDEATYDGTGGSTAALGGWHYAVNPNTEYLDACLSFLEAMATEEFMLDLFELVGYIPPKPEIVNSEEAAETEVMGRYVETLQYAGEHAMPRPVTVLWPEQSNRIEQQVSDVLAGDLDPGPAMDELRETLASLEAEGQE